MEHSGQNERPGASEEPVDWDDEEIDLGNLTMMRMAVSYEKDIKKKLPSVKGVKSDLSEKPNKLASCLASFIDMDEGCPDEVKTEHGLVAQFSHWAGDTGATLGASNCFSEARAHKEPGLGSLAPRHMMTLQESTRISPDCHLTWLCDGRLLQLYDAISPGNLKLFQY